MTGSLAHPPAAGVAGSADSPACDGRSHGAARRAKHGSAGRRPVWPAQHYGRVPRFRPYTWTFTVMGATESGAEHRWDWAGITRLPRCAVTADLHCVTRCTTRAIAWEGIPATEILSAAPPTDV